MKLQILQDIVSVVQLKLQIGFTKNNVLICFQVSYTVVRRHSVEYGLRKGRDEEFSDELKKRIMHVALPEEIPCNTRSQGKNQE